MNDSAENRLAGLADMKRVLSDLNELFPNAAPWSESDGIKVSALPKLLDKWKVPATTIVGKRGERRVVCAACLYGDGIMLTGPRHFDAVMRDQYRRAGLRKTEDQCVQGFVDQWGVFMTREEAYLVAKEQGQIRYRCGGDEGKLFSENLY